MSFVIQKLFILPTVIFLAGLVKCPQVLGAGVEGAVGVFEGVFEVDGDEIGHRHMGRLPAAIFVDVAVEPIDMAVC
jgi:hypothetical protein